MEAMAPDLAAAVPTRGLGAVNGIRCQSVATADAESSKGSGSSRGVGDVVGTPSCFAGFGAWGFSLEWPRAMVCGSSRLPQGSWEGHDLRTEGGEEKRRAT